MPQPEVLSARTNPANNLTTFITLYDLSKFTPAAVNAFQLPTPSMSGFAMVDWPDFACAVESGVKDANQKFFAVAGGFFRRANVEFNPRRAMQQPDDSARQAFRVGDTVARQPLAEIPRLANIQDAF